MKYVVSMTGGFLAREPYLSLGHTVPTNDFDAAAKFDTFDAATAAARFANGGMVHDADKFQPAPKKPFDDRPYNIRRAERLAKHAKSLTNVERTLVTSVSETVRAKLRGANLAYALDVIAEGMINANDTVLVERGRERSEWACMFVASMGSLLADGTRAIDLASTCDVKRVRAVFKSIHVEG